LIAKIQGISKEQNQEIFEFLKDFMDLNNCREKKAKNLSGG
jgi:hypothetical protein